MPKTRLSYPLEFKRQMIELVRAGRKTAIRDTNAASAPDLVEREFSANASNKLWLADITYIPTRAGFMYLAVVIDADSRRVVGWAMVAHLRTELVVAALQMAIEQRHPAGVIHHSDHGAQYTATAFGKRCREAGIRPSMGSVGDCYNNAMCESFFATLECELLDRHTFNDRGKAQMAVFEFIEGWYNPHRRHSSIEAGKVSHEHHHGSRQRPYQALHCP